MTFSVRYRPSGYLSAVLAELFEPVEAGTPFGGLAVSHEARGVVWLKVGRRGRREPERGGVVEVVETMKAMTRVDPRLVEGWLLRFGGGDWTILGVAVEGGRAELNLERRR